MAERRMAEVMGQGYGLGKLFVKAQGLRYGARYLRHLYRVGKARSVVISLVIDENLGLILETPERVTVDYPVAVPLKDRPEGMLGLGITPSPRIKALYGVRREPLGFLGCYV